MFRFFLVTESMKFIDLPYSRPDVLEVSELLTKLINKLENASSTDDLLSSMARAKRKEREANEAIKVDVLQHPSSDPWHGKTLNGNA